MAYDTPSFRFFIVLFIGSCHGLMTHPLFFSNSTIFYSQKQNAKDYSGLLGSSVPIAGR